MRDNPSKTGLPEKEAAPTFGLTGVAVNCQRLNVRKAPSLKADIAAVITALTEVAVQDENGSGEFYRVALPNGTSGFCMKKFIALRK
jgi:uncharacterized protein YgiM (DUF1202 family)